MKLSRVAIVGCCLVVVSGLGCGKSRPQDGGVGQGAAKLDAGKPAPKRAIVGRWTATDDSGVVLDFDSAGKLVMMTQGQPFGEPGDYTFVDDRRVEVTGKNFVIVYNTKPLPMAFTVDFDEDGRGMTIAPTAERPMMMQFQLFGNGKLHVFPPEKKPARYARAG